MSLTRLLDETGQGFWEDCSRVTRIAPHPERAGFSWLFREGLAGPLLLKGTPDEVSRGIQRGGLRSPIGGSRCTLSIALQNDGPGADGGELSVQIDGPVRTPEGMRLLKQALERALMEMQFTVTSVMARRDELLTAPQQDSVA